MNKLRVYCSLSCSEKRYRRISTRRCRELVLRYKLNHPCKCGESDPICLDLHHRVPSKKEFTISTAVTRRYDLERLQKEIKKCDVLCANCHRKHHAVNYAPG